MRFFVVLRATVLRMYTLVNTPASSSRRGRRMMEKVRDDFLDVLYQTYPMLRKKEVKMRSAVALWSDNRGRINLHVWVQRGNRTWWREFVDIGYRKAYIISSRIGRLVRAGRCVVHPTVSEYVGWEARFGFQGR